MDVGRQSCTNIIDQLYSVRDDVADDESEDNKSEYLCVGEFSDRVAAAHARNYSSAAYLALRSEVSPSQFHRDDLVSILEPLVSLSLFGKVSVLASS